MTTISTRYGRTWNLLDPQASSVSFWEIAEVLARIPRFNGHTQEHYSVAQHCCLAHDHVCEDENPELRLLALLHDAHEAYIGDIVTPVKEALNSLIDGDQVEVWLEMLKTSHDRVIRKAAGVARIQDLEDLEQVKEVDKALLLNEQYQLMHPSAFGRPEDKSIPVEPWEEDLAAEEFLKRLNANPIYEQQMAQQGNLTHPQFLHELEQRLIAFGFSPEQSEDAAGSHLIEFLDKAGYEFGAPERKWDQAFVEEVFNSGFWMSEDFWRVEDAS
ncbi:hypothetical protein [Pseudovibrio sp. POLY-S9]|uniref:hypothetical protein n=1 Tax=Pseudovibrio sp. POLY-S9 TaxID=1576596 RepID=UPI00070A5B2B|nr:hypothetical protein [Pseudovibrio sp. POLY-S9]